MMAPYEQELPNTTKQHEEAISRQNKIGMLHYGKITKMWTKIQERYLNHKHIPTATSSEQWTKRLLVVIQKHAHAIWMHRNEINNATNASNEHTNTGRLDERVKQLHSQGQDTVAVPDKNLFSGTATSILSMRKMNKSKWIESVVHAQKLYMENIRLERNRQPVITIYMHPL